jgi:hypothetical protein
MRRLSIPAKAPSPPKGAIVQSIMVSATPDDQSQAAALFLVGVLNDMR